MKGLRTTDLRSIWAECRERMRHVRLQGAIDAYVDGELTPARRAQVAAHLACCWACSGYAQTLRLIKASLRRGPDRAPASLSETRLRRFADRLPSSPQIREPDPRPADGTDPEEP
jgi:anti-sigma factor RsiW